MRGRTNVKDGISLNASVEEFEVASGESIVAGNMVTMYAENGEPLESVLGGVTCTWRSPLIELTNGEYFGLPNKVFTKNADNTFSLKNTLSTNIPNEDTVYAGNNRFVHIAASIISYKLRIDCTVYVLDLSDYSISTYTSREESTDSIINGTTSNFTNQIVDFLSGYVIGYCNCTLSNSASMVGNGIYHIDISDLNNIDIVFDSVSHTSDGTNTSGNISKLTRFVSGNNNYYFDGLTIHKYTFASGVLTRSLCKLENGSLTNGLIYKIQETGTIGVLHILNSRDLFNKVYSVSGFEVTGVLKNEKVFTFPTTTSTNNMGLLQMSESKHLLYTTSRSLVSVVTVGSDVVLGEPKELGYQIQSTQFMALAKYTSVDNLDVAFIKNVANANIRNNEFTLNGDITRYVKNAVYEEYIRGIAKQSGSAGETIEVYVPEV